MQLLRLPALHQSLFSVAVFFPRDAVRLLDGQARHSQRPSASGHPVTFHFCADCGSTLWWEPERMPHLAGVAVGTFADAAFAAPTQADWTADKHHWLTFPEIIAEHEQIRRQEAEPMWEDRRRSPDRRGALRRKELAPGYTNPATLRASILSGTNAARPKHAQAWPSTLVSSDFSPAGVDRDDRSAVKTLPGVGCTDLRPPYLAGACARTWR